MNLPVHVDGQYPQDCVIGLPKNSEPVGHQGAFSSTSVQDEYTISL